MMVSLKLETTAYVFVWILWEHPASMAKQNMKFFKLSPYL